MSNSDCSGQACRYELGQRVCGRVGCAIGRPFIVANEVRVAECVRRTDWAQSPAPNLSEMAVDVRELLAQRWASVAQLEHASIASFARFSLELLGLGAPAELVEAAQRAQADEIRHARQAFGLASAYAGAPFGPARLAMDAVLSECSPLEIARSVIVEGCILETIGAAEAHEAFEQATDPAVREVLAQVAADETRHAELAWRALRWLLSVAVPGERRAMVQELEAAVERMRSDSGRELEPEPDARCSALLAHGILTEELRSEVRRQVTALVIVPGAAALVRAVAHDSADGLSSETYCTV